MMIFMTYLPESASVVVIVVNAGLGAAIPRPIKLAIPKTNKITYNEFESKEQTLQNIADDSHLFLHEIRKINTSSFVLYLKGYLCHNIIWCFL